MNTNTNTTMNTNTNTTESSVVDRALAYLASKGAIHKLSTPCPVLYRDIVMWRCGGEKNSDREYDLPPLTVNRI